MTMIVRLLTQDDAQDNENLASQAFCGSADTTDCTLPSDIMPGAFDDDGTLMADMEVYDRKLGFFGDTLNCAAIGGVASKPEYRNRGAIRAVFNETFSALNEKYNWDVSVLYPFSLDYYRQFGYESAADSMELTMPFTCLKKLKRATAELYTGDQLDELLEFYNGLAKTQHISFIRTDTNYYDTKPYVSVKYTYMWRGADGKIGSYATLLPDRSEKIMMVSELFYSDKASLEGILGFLRCYEGNFRTLKFSKLSANCPVLSLISEPDKTTRKLFSTGAVRILNIENVLKKTKYPNEKGSFTVKTTDRLKQNCGCFHVEYENTAATVTRLDSDDADVVLDQNAANILFCGTAGPEALRFTAGAEIVNENPDFFKAFTPRNILFCDGF